MRRVATSDEFAGNPLAGYTLFQFVASIGNGANAYVGDWVPPPLPPGVKLNNTDEWHWCGAWMNAAANNIGGTGVVDFPYTPAQVVAIYGNPGSFNTTRAEALKFFKKLEN